MAREGPRQRRLFLFGCIQALDIFWLKFPRKLFACFSPGHVFLTISLLSGSTLQRISRYRWSPSQQKGVYAHFLDRIYQLPHFPVLLRGLVSTVGSPCSFLLSCSIYLGSPTRFEFMKQQSKNCSLAAGSIATRRFGQFLSILNFAHLLIAYTFT